MKMVLAADEHHVGEKEMITGKERGREKKERNWTESREVIDCHIEKGHGLFEKRQNVRNE